MHAAEPVISAPDGPSGDGKSSGYCHVFPVSTQCARDPRHSACFIFLLMSCLSPAASSCLRGACQMKLKIAVMLVFVR